MIHPAPAFGLAMAIWVSVIAPEAEDADASATCVPASQCCEICDRGKACGNSCISRAKTCHKGRGCACNASEICAEP